MKCSLSVLERKRKANKAANKALHKIGEKLGIPIDLTTYVARHSYATVLKRSGVSTAIISESIGHSSEKVTQIYLDSFENTQIDEASGQSGSAVPCSHSAGSVSYIGQPTNVRSSSYSASYIPCDDRHCHFLL